MEQQKLPNATIDYCSKYRGYFIAAVLQGLGMYTFCNRLEK